MPEDNEVDEQNVRQSQEASNVNARGRSDLLEVCTALNVRILNGRVVGDLDGKKTCYNGSSLVDGVISSKNILLNIRYLTVNPLKPHLPGHCQLSYAIKANLAKLVSLDKLPDYNLSEYKRLQWNISSKGKQFSLDPNNLHLKTILREEKRKFKKSCRRKKRLCTNKRLADIDCRKPKETWKKINNIFKFKKAKSERVETERAREFLCILNGKMRRP